MSDYRYLHDPNFHVNPLSGARTEYIQETDGSVYLRRTEDDEPVKEFARQARLSHGQHQKFDEMQHVASIPMHLLTDMLMNNPTLYYEILGDQDVFKAWLNSEKVAAYRTRDYKV